MRTKTIQKQEKQFKAESIPLIATVRHDDSYNNGHNTFSITGEFDRTSGYIHEKIAKHLPLLAPLIKWHLTSTDGPLHYVANTVYHVKERNLDYARSTAVWPEASDEELTAPGLEDRLKARLPELMENFKKAVESLGFIY